MQNRLNTRGRRQRNKKGSMLAEAPVALFFLFIVVTLPAIDLGTICLRQMFLVAAAHNAAHVASKCKTFATSTNKPSAIVAADQTAKATAGGFSGIEVETVKTYILSTDIETQATEKFSGALSRPADTSSYVYNIQVDVTAKVYPLVTLSSNIFGNVPGLTVPVESKASATEFVEYTQGLNY